MAEQQCVSLYRSTNISVEQCKRSCSGISKKCSRAVAQLAVCDSGSFLLIPSLRRGVYVCAWFMHAAEKKRETSSAGRTCTFKPPASYISRAAITHRACSRLLITIYSAVSKKREKESVGQLERRGGGGIFKLGRSPFQLKLNDTHTIIITPSFKTASCASDQNLLTMPIVDVLQFWSTRHETRKRAHSITELVWFLALVIRDQ